MNRSVTCPNCSLCGRWLSKNEEIACVKCLPLLNSGYIKQCEACDSTTTYVNKRGLEQWCFHDGHRLCQKCYGVYVRNPVDNPISNKKYLASTMARREKSISFLGRIVYVGINPRKGVCELCGKKGVTDMHHMEYQEDDPLKDTIELCDSCHAYETQAQMRMNRQYYENQIVVTNGDNRI